MGRQRDAPAAADAKHAENVIPFVRPPNGSAEGNVPPVVLKNSERPAPRAANSADRPLWIFLFLLGSLVLHGSLLALFRREPEPYSSVGIPAISVEIMLGAYTPAGVAQLPSPNETDESAPAEEEIKPVDPVPVEQAEEKKPDEPVQQAETEPEKEPAAIEEIPAAKIEPLPPQEKPEPPTAEAVPEAKPVQPKHELKQQVKEAKQAPEKPKERTKQPPANRNAPAASGVGQGRSSADANYHGLVAAHLRRHRPTDALAQRAEGTASITFAVDGTGRVTSVRLVRTSGVPVLDQEAVSMVRRASPFPAPPEGRPMSFTVPVSFAVR